MTKLFYVPIEPLEERYTEQWYRQFPIEFSIAGFDVQVIDGEVLTNFVDVGAFLPMNSTVHYKNSQMMKIAKLFQDKLVSNGDVFFIADTEFWGLESIRLMADMNRIKVKVFSFLHAASYTKEDAFEIAASYQKYTELGWVLSCDKVFVGSEYHRRAFLQRRAYSYATVQDQMAIEKKIVVTGNPLFRDDYKLDVMPEKKNQIIISNRFDWEKRPNMSLSFAYIIKKRFPDTRIVVTTSRPTFKSNKSWLVDMARGMEKDGIIEIHDGLSKKEYHTLLAESKVMLSNSIEENFGYCIAEAMVYNTYPLLKNELSHPELVEHDPRLLFNDEDEIVDKIVSLMSARFDVTKYSDKYMTDKSCNPIIKMLREMK